jgi:sec-independent protein translocase protein TatB
MFDIAWSELLIIAVVAIVVVGPKDLPRLMRTFGHYAGKMRRAAADFQRQFDEAMRDSEVDEVRKAIESVRTTSTQTAVDLKAPIDKPLMLPTTPPPPVVPSTAPGTQALAAPPTIETASKPTARPKRASKPKAASPTSGSRKTASGKTKTAEIETTTANAKGVETADAKPAGARRRKKKAEGTA